MPLNISSAFHHVEFFFLLPLLLAFNHSNKKQAAEVAVQGGIKLISDSEHQHAQKWNIMQAIFFASTVLTTIGT